MKEKDVKRMRASGDLPKGKFVVLLCVWLILVASAAGGGSMEPEINEGCAVINGAEHYYRIIGDGEPLIVLHGGPGLFHEYFLPHLESLADEYQLIFYDQRASGNSSKDVPPESVSTGNFVEDLDGIRERCGLEKVNLLGHSWGGLLALHYALTYPDRIDKIILVDSAPPNSELDEINFKAREERRSEEDVKKIKEIMASEAFQKMEPQAIKSYFQVSEKVKFFNPDLISKMRVSLDQEKIAKLMWVGQLMNPHLADYDIVEDLSSITSPVLIIHGEYDTIPVDSARLIHSQVKGSKLVLVKDCGHFPFIEAPEIFAREVKAFLVEDKKH